VHPGRDYDIRRSAKRARRSPERDDS
jgi:hypothetical protein